MKTYEEWKKTKEHIYDYKSSHPLYEQLVDIVSEIMYLDGPDRHTDGSNLIASYILENFLVSTKEPKTPDRESLRNIGESR